MTSRIPLLCALGALVAFSGCANKPQPVKPKINISRPPAQTAPPSTIPAKPGAPGAGGQSAQPGSPLENAFSGKGTANPFAPQKPPAARPGATAMPGIGGAKPAAVVPPVGRPDPKKLFLAVEAAYRSFITLRQNGVSSNSITQDGKVMAKQLNQKFTAIVKKPAKFVLTSPESTLSCDGKTVTIYYAGPKRYSKMPFGKDVARQMVYSKPGVGLMGLLWGEEYSVAVDSYKLLKDAKISGKDTFVLSLRFKKGVGGLRDGEMTETLWIGKRDLGIYRNDLVTTIHPKAPKGYKGKVPKIIISKLSNTVTSFMPNVKLSDSQFVFKAPSGAKPVEMPKQVNLQGKPAPDLSFKWTDGTRKSLSDFMGKPVVLVFWAMPMSDSNLSSMQNAYNSGTEFIAICFNRDTDKVKQFLQKKKYTMPIVFADEELTKTVAEKYGIQGLPTVMTIDKNGIVRAISLGMPDKKGMDAMLKKAGA